MKRTVILLLCGCFILTTIVTGQATEYRCYTWEKLKSSGPDLKLIGQIEVKHSKDIQSSLWSVGCETLDRDQAKFSVYKEYLGELGYQSNSSRKLTVAGFKKEGVPVVLILFNDQIPSDIIEWDPVDIKIKATNFSDPVYVEIITGKVYEIDKATFRANGGDVKFDRLPLWYSPIMIAERSQIPMVSFSTPKNEVSK